MIYKITMAKKNEVRNQNKRVRIHPSMIINPKQKKFINKSWIQIEESDFINIYNNLISPVLIIYEQKA
jgi:hypothetical protein